MPWRQLLLESHAIAVISATGVGLLAFPGADLTKAAQPALVRMVAPAEPATASVVSASKGPPARLRGETDTAPAAAAEKAPPVNEESVAPVPDRRSFEGCVNAHEHAACRRAFEAAIERQGGFALAPAGSRLGAQPLDAFSSLDFEDAPKWRRTLESVSQDGITFKRMRRGNEHELSFGISRDGVLGFTLAERRDSDR